MQDGFHGRMCRVPGRGHGQREEEELEQWYLSLPRDIQHVKDNRRKTPRKCGARVPRADPSFLSLHSCISLSFTLHPAVRLE